VGAIVSIIRQVPTVKSAFHSTTISLGGGETRHIPMSVKNVTAIDIVQVAFTTKQKDMAYVRTVRITPTETNATNAVSCTIETLQWNCGTEMLVPLVIAAG
jgi:hypothetical protein